MFRGVLNLMRITKIRWFFRWIQRISHNYTVGLGFLDEERIADYFKWKMKILSLEKQKAERKGERMKIQGQIHRWRIKLLQMVVFQFLRGREKGGDRDMEAWFRAKWYFSNLRGFFFTLSRERFFFPLSLRRSFIFGLGQLACSFFSSLCYTITTLIATHVKCE